MTNSNTSTRPARDKGRWSRVLRYLSPGLCSSAAVFGLPVPSQVWHALLKERTR
jgi:hypothetical protein